MWSQIKASAQWLTKPFLWIQSKWLAFEDWIATWLPGLKTKITAGFGAIGSGALFVQEWLTGIPVEKLISPTAYILLGATLFTLVYFFRRIAK